MEWDVPTLSPDLPEHPCGGVGKCPPGFIKHGKWHTKKTLVALSKVREDITVTGEASGLFWECNVALRGRFQLMRERISRWKTYSCKRYQYVYCSVGIRTEVIEDPWSAGCEAGEYSWGDLKIEFSGELAYSNCKYLGLIKDRFDDIKDIFELVIDIKNVLRKY
jgi:hypothetical protein